MVYSRVGLRLMACAELGKGNSFAYGLFFLGLIFLGSAFNNANTSVATYGSSSSNNTSTAVVPLPSSFIDTAVPTIPIISPTTNDKNVDVSVCYFNL